MRGDSAGELRLYNRQVGLPDIDCKGLVLRSGQTHLDFVGPEDVHHR